jgi:molybdopterin converting factor small subunit
MKVMVKAFGILKEGVVTLELKEGSTVHDAIRQLSEIYAKEIENLLIARTGEIDDELLVFHNGTFVENAQTRLHDGELILTFPFITGG